MKAVMQTSHRSGFEVGLINVTSIYVAELDGDRARLRSRAIGVLPDGTVIVGATKTRPYGWPTIGASGAGISPCSGRTRERAVVQQRHPTDGSPLSPTCRPDETAG
jgi:hypothetical protein